MGLRNNLNGDDSYDWMAANRLAEEEYQTRRAIERETEALRDETRSIKKAIMEAQMAADNAYYAERDRQYFLHNPRPVDVLYAQTHDELINYVDNHTFTEMNRAHLFFDEATLDNQFAAASEKKTMFYETNMFNSFAATAQRKSIILFSILVSIASFWWLGIVFYLFWNLILKEIDAEREQRFKFTMYSEEFQKYLGAGPEQFSRDRCGRFYVQNTFTASVPPNMHDNDVIFQWQSAAFFWYNFKDKVLNLRCNRRPYKRKTWRELLRM